MSLSPILESYLQVVLDYGGSDLHLEAGAPPAIRLNGDIKFLDEPPIERDQAEEILLPILSDHLAQEFLDTGNVDFSYEVQGMGRFRVNFLLQNRGMGGVFRAIPNRVPTLDDLNLPPVISRIANIPKGLVVVTGPTGSGKSTTLAAIVNHINKTQRKHIITIEDPIEFVHASDKSMIQQREIGAHARDFARSLRAALRESPDVILLGEMRDLETISEAIRAAETGHLVLGTLHTNSAAKTVDRIVDVFPAGEQEQIRSMLSASLKAVIAQQLLQTRDKKGRVAVLEIMMVNFGIAGLIRESKTSMISSFIHMGSEEGMQSMDSHLIQLCKAGWIDTQTAFDHCVDRGTLRRSGLVDPNGYDEDEE
ncbi:type IV pilus twitching motility protein PilT [bacterium]|nr:type IV pilus twitching motility protein PilT [bacterium]